MASTKLPQRIGSPRPFRASLRPQAAGFTFIEVMVAMLIMVLAVVAAVNITRGAVRATRDSKEISIATWLAQTAIVDLETKVETEGVEKGCDKKKDGKFKAPYEQYTWTTYCTEIEFNISQEAAKIAAAAGNTEKEDENSSENMIQKMILQAASDYITKSLRELHAEVKWTEGKQQRSIALTTHFVRYDQPLTLPGVGGGGGGK